MQHFAIYTPESNSLLECNILMSGHMHITVHILNKNIGMQHALPLIAMVYL